MDECVLRSLCCKTKLKGSLYTKSRAIILMVTGTIRRDDPPLGCPWITPSQRTSMNTRMRSMPQQLEPMAVGLKIPMTLSHAWITEESVVTIRSEFLILQQAVELLVHLRTFS